MENFTRAFTVSGNVITDSKPTKKAGNAGENIVTSLSFTFSSEWDNAIKSIVFKSPKNKLLTPQTITGSIAPIPQDALDSGGTLQFSLMGAFADSEQVIRTPTYGLDVESTLSILGGTPLATYTNVVLDCQLATQEAITAKDAAVLATERIDATDAGIKAAEAIREADERARKEAEEVRAGFYDGFNAKLAETMNQAISTFSSRLASGTITKINLYGDSITAGYDAIGAAQDQTGKVILNNGTEIFKETLKTPRCWANLFREYISAKAPSIIFTNKGINSKSTKYFWNNKQCWTDTTEDVVFLCLGHNDLWDCSTLQEFAAFYEDSVNYLLGKSNLLICINPSVKKNEDVAGVDPNGFTIRDLDMVITEVCKRKGIPQIRMNSDIMDRLALEKKSLTQFLNDDNAHPSDAGHGVMWRILQNKLGIADIVNADYGVLDKTIILQSQALIDLAFTFDSDITQFSIFSESGIYLIPVSAANAATIKTPGNKPGTMIIYIAAALYKPRLTHCQFCSGEDAIMYFRSFLADRTWTSWKMSGGVTPEVANIYLFTTQASGFSYGLTYCNITGSNSTLASFPEGKPGVLETFKGDASDNYSYQIYHVYDSVNTYKRKNGANTWGAFVKTNA